MNNFPTHPEEAVLLRLVDAELPALEKRQVEEHLEACPECRAQVEELRATLAECFRYREDVLEALLPAPPKPWADLRAGFAEIDRSLAPAAREPWWRIKPPLRWALAAAAAILLAVFYGLRETPSVEAASLLQKAEMAASQRTATAPRRVLFRTRYAQFTRVIGRRDAMAALPKEPAAPALEALFQAAHWDWNDPLSAQAFAGCRDSLERKTDSVTTTADTYQIRTTTPEGELAAASLTLRATDLAPLEARLEFRSRDWVELSAVAGETEDGGTIGGTPAPHPLEPGAQPAAPRLPAPAVAAAAPPVSAVLQVLTALHGIGADLGEQVEVKPVEGRLVVTGVGIPAARQREIAAALEKFPNVVVEFSEPGAPPVTTEPPAAATAPPENPGAGMAARVERQLGGHPQFERFSAQMLDWSDAAMAQAYALRRLAERFPASAEASFSQADRQTLRELARENVATMAGITAKMSRTLEPVLTAMGGQAGAGPAAPPDAWQPAAEDLVATAQRVERRLSVMLGAAPSDGGAFTPSDLSSDLKLWEDDIAICQRLLARE